MAVFALFCFVCKLPLFLHCIFWIADYMLLLCNPLCFGVSHFFFSFSVLTSDVCWCVHINMCGRPPGSFGLGDQSPAIVHFLGPNIHHYS